MTKNTSDKYAKAIMMELAAIHALVEQVQAYDIAQMAAHQQKSRQEVSNVLKVAHANRVKELYRDMLDFSQRKEEFSELFTSERVKHEPVNPIGQ